jgi:hypothetical protein
MYVTAPPKTDPVLELDSEPDAPRPESAPLIGGPFPDKRHQVLLSNLTCALTVLNNV